MNENAASPADGVPESANGVPESADGVPESADGVPEPAVLEAFGLAPGTARRASSGLINQTWHVLSQHGEPRILQRLSPIFPARINAQIDALTSHLAAKGLLTPRIVPTTQGRLWLERDGHVWRVLTAIEGVSHDAIGSSAQAREAGRALARFHAAVADFDHDLADARLGVHDTAAHIERLERARHEYRAHAEMNAVAPIAESVLAFARRLPPLPPAPDRVVHGDPKISNILFDAQSGRSLCLIDLDTVARMPVALELGDAMRSWCNPAAEDSPAAHCSVPRFTAAVHGYAEDAAEGLTRAEWSAIPAATLTIAVELAARFCADALAERYFGWDRLRYPSSSAHQCARAEGQLALARSIESRLGELAAIVEAAFGSNDAR